ncbi:MAG: bifunctional riboflavin kinase/FAD synthetase [Chloroflexota bacterium]|nr:bifunctional riboflavin kinase/FAD synthetase [Chloroflexota bacterium]
MRIYNELSSVQLDRESLLAIGVFDGVHAGHRHLIEDLTDRASSTGKLAGVVTFKTHPAEFLDSYSNIQYLTSLDQRIKLLEDIGVDFVVPVTFDHEFSELRAKDFISLLQNHLNMVGIVIGEDFAMGHNREGDVKTLVNMGKHMGFSVDVVRLVGNSDSLITSTAIRKMVSLGKIEEASRFLGRNFVLEGNVVRGAGRGSVLGFPTANIETENKMLLPGDGIYATWVDLNNRRHMASTSIGTRPTFEETERTIEAYLLDFSGDLYGQLIRLEFVERLRDEEKYDTVDKLLVQMANDVERTRSIMSD